MVKRLAAAVMAAFVGLIGPLSLDATPFDDSDDGEDIEVIQCHGEREGKPGSEGRSSRAALLAAARVCGEPVHAAWVAASHGRPRAAVTVELTSRDVAAVNLTADPRAGGRPDWLPALLARALHFCRDQGCLKVVVAADGVPPAALRPLVESRGFQWSRARLDDGGAEVAEFYTDLYRRDDAPARHAPA